MSLVAGVKTPWGRNDLSENGERLDEHAQSGTGATDVYGGLSAVVLLDPQSSVSRRSSTGETGTNDLRLPVRPRHDRRTSRTSASSAASSTRSSRRTGGTPSRTSWTRTGTATRTRAGDLVYLTPRLVLDLGGGILGRVGVQIPIVKSLYGDQTERANVNVGLTVLF